MTDLVRRWLRVAFEQLLGHQNESRRAKAALKSAVGDERLLNWMQFTIGSEPFDSRHFSPVHKSRQVKTPANRDAVHDCGAAPAESLPAALASAKEAEVAPQNLEQRLVCGNLGDCGPAVEFESDRPPVVLLHQSLPNGRFCARRRARSTRSGVSGISVMRTSIASYSAFPIAGDTQNMPVSPTPLAPNGPCLCGTSTSSPVRSSGRSSIPGIL